MKRLVTILLMFSLVLVVQAADPFKTAKAALKSKNNLDASEKELVAHAKKTETKPSDRARAYNMAAQIVRKMYEVENEKLYLKTSFDTVRYFSSIQRLYMHTACCDSICGEPDENGRLSQQFAKENRKMRTDLRSNLLQGGKWMMQRRRYAEAALFFDTYCRVDSDLMTGDAQRDQIALWATKCAYADGNMDLTLRYADRALNTGSDVANLLEYKSRAYLAKGDSVEWENTLRRGMNQCPQHLFFFASMNVHLRKMRQLREALEWNKKMIEACPDTVQYRYALGQTYYDLNEWDSCIAACGEVISRMPSHAQSHFNCGVSWLRKAEAFAKSSTYDTKSDRYREERRLLLEMYENARKSMETYRELMPDEKSVWAPLLYKVYYALNMGTELEEVEKQMK